MAVSQPAAEEVAETLAKGSSCDDGEESRYLDEYPPDSPRLAPSNLAPISDDFGLLVLPGPSPDGTAHESTSTTQPVRTSTNKHDAHGEDDDDVAPPAGFFESDAIQRSVVTISVLVALYSAVMAALLAIFVPQHCCPKVKIIFACSMFDNHITIQTELNALFLGVDFRKLSTIGELAGMPRQVRLTQICLDAPLLCAFAGLRMNAEMQGRKTMHKSLRYVPSPKMSISKTTHRTTTMWCDSLSF